MQVFGRKFWIYAFVATFLVTPPLSTQGQMQSEIKQCGKVAVDHVTSSGQFQTKSGDTISLADIKAPEYWDADADYKSWPMGAEAKAYLENLVTGKTVSLYCDGSDVSVFGDKIRHVLLPDGRWLQQAMVRDAMALVYPSPDSHSDNYQRLEILFEAEGEARVEAKGIWSERGPKLLTDADRVEAGLFQIVRFPVHQAAEVRGTLYINAGADWRKDFTIEISRKLAKRFDDETLEQLQTSGTHIEVRGWVFWKNGPTIAPNNPAHIRIVQE